MQFQKSESEDKTGDTQGTQGYRDTNWADGYSTGRNSIVRNRTNNNSKGKHS